MINRKQGKFRASEVPSRVNAQPQQQRSFQGVQKFSRRREDFLNHREDLYRAQNNNFQKNPVREEKKVFYWGVVFWE